MTMTLAANVASMFGRPLSKDESEALAKFQKSFEIDDQDPIIVVLAMLATNRLYMQELPALLQQKVVTTIELHQQTLRDQSTLIAKELIGTVVLNFQAAGKGTRDQVLNCAFAFVAGLLTTAVIYHFH
jgi:hypothetical protein